VRWHARHGLYRHSPNWCRRTKGGARPLTSEVVEAMTTNETFFFRDRVPFIT